MNEKRADRRCPLLIAAGLDDVERQKCLGNECALYVTLQKPVMFGDGKVSYPDPEYKLSYRGCGLVVNIPWEAVKREQKPPHSRAVKDPNNIRKAGELLTDETA